MTTPLSDPAVTWDLDLMVTAEESGEEQCEDPMYWDCANVATHVIEASCGCTMLSCLRCGERVAQIMAEFVRRKKSAQCEQCHKSPVVVVVRPKGK